MFEAMVSFSGPKISMAAGEVRKITDKALAADLLQAGYIRESRPDADSEEAKAVKKPVRKKRG